MRSRLWYLSGIVMFVVSPGAFAEIVFDGGWYAPPLTYGWGEVTSTTEASSATADVDGFYYYYGSASANPWSSACTTLRAQCEWRFWVYAYSEARLYLSGAFQPCFAYVWTEAHAHSTCSNYTFDPQDFFFWFYIDQTDFDGSHYEIVRTDGGENHDQDYAWFNAGEGVYAEHTGAEEGLPSK